MAKPKRIQLVVCPCIPLYSGDYLYDGRYRLTKATRDNATTSPTITATYEYTYDDGDK